MSPRTHWRGAKLLAEWRAALDKNQQEAADLIGIDLARYNAFEKNRARPGLDWAVQIEKVSKGVVSTSSWTESIGKKAKAS